MYRPIQTTFAPRPCRPPMAQLHERAPNLKPTRSSITLAIVGTRRMGTEPKRGIAMLARFSQVTLNRTPCAAGQVLLLGRCGVALSRLGRRLCLGAARREFTKAATPKKKAQGERIGVPLARDQDSNKILARQSVVSSGTTQRRKRSCRRAGNKTPEPCLSNDRLPEIKAER